MSNLPKSRTLEEQDSKNQDSMLEKIPDLGNDGFIPPGSELTIDTIRCFGEWLIILPLQESETTRGGIHLREESRRIPTVGIIVGAGDLAVKHLCEPYEELIGSHVKFSPRSAGVEVDPEDFDTYENVGLKIVHMKNVISYVDPKLEITIRGGRD